MAMGNFLKIRKQASYIAALIDPSLYETNKHLKVYEVCKNEEICPRNDDFYHTALDTLALQ